MLHLGAWLSPDVVRLQVNWTDLSKGQRLLLLLEHSHLLLPGQEGGGGEEGDGRGRVASSSQAAAPFGSGPGV